MNFLTPFEFGQRVTIDDTDLAGRVTAFCWRDTDGHTVEVSWIHNGDAKSAWLPAWRIKAA